MLHGNIAPTRASAWSAQQRQLLAVPRRGSGGRRNSTPSFWRMGLTHVDAGDDLVSLGGERVGRRARASSKGRRGLLPQAGVHGRVGARRAGPAHTASCAQPHGGVGSLTREPPVPRVAAAAAAPTSPAPTLGVCRSVVRPIAPQFHHVELSIPVARPIAKFLTPAPRVRAVILPAPAAASAEPRQPHRPRQRPVAYVGDGRRRAPRRPPARSAFAREPPGTRRFARRPVARCVPCGRGEDGLSSGNARSTSPTVVLGGREADDRARRSRLRR